MTKQKQNKFYMVAWTPPDPREVNLPTYGKLKVGPHPDSEGWSIPYFYTDGDCMLDARNMSFPQRASFFMSIFILAVVRDGIDAKEAFEEFKKIPEFYYYIAEGMGYPDDNSPYRL